MFAIYLAAVLNSQASRVVFSERGRVGGRQEDCSNSGEELAAVAAATGVEWAKIRGPLCPRVYRGWQETALERVFVMVG